MLNVLRSFGFRHVLSFLIKFQNDIKIVYENYREHYEIVYTMRLYNVKIRDDTRIILKKKLNGFSKSVPSSKNYQQKQLK